MNPLVIGVLLFQTVSSTLAILFNSFLIFIIRTYNNHLGFYNMILTCFAVFEILYALIIIIGMPIHYIAKQTWIGLNIFGPLFGGPLAKAGPILYCLCYEVWVGFITFNFLYRYVVVCRENWSLLITSSTFWKMIIGLLLLVYTTACLFCSHFFCTANNLPAETLEDIDRHFGVENITEIAYVVRITKDDGSISVGGISSVLFHIILATGSLIIVAFCAFEISQVIKINLKKLNNRENVTLNVSLERQLFFSLLIQATIPIVFFIMPSLFLLIYPIFFNDFSIFATFSPFFSLSITFPKALDPIITMFCIKEYRNAVLRMFREGATGAAGASSLARASMPGIIEKVLVKADDLVRQGQSLVVMTAMKMKYIIKAPINCCVSAASCAPEKNMAKNAIFIQSFIL